MTKISKAVFKKDNKYLLLKRAMHSKSFSSFSGLWDFAGGKLDPGETPEEAVTREVKEETNIIIKPGKAIKTAEYKDENYDLLFYYFIPDKIVGVMKLSSEQQEDCTENI